MAEEWIRLLGALVRDVEAMRAYEAQIALGQKRQELTRAWNILSRSGAYEQAATRHSLMKYKLFLQSEIDRPVPPKGFEREPELWRIVREDMKRQLKLLGGPVPPMSGA